MSNVNKPPHPRDWLKLWHAGMGDYVTVVSNNCMYCDGKVNVLDPTQYVLYRHNGDSFNGYEAHHYLCGARADFYFDPQIAQQQQGE